MGWTSSDGISWARVPLDDADLGAKGPVEASDELFYSRHTMADVAPGGPGFVAVGDEYLWFGIVNADRRGAEWSAAV